MGRYVCAFRGRRDFYQVPLALAESAQLDQLITDAYAMPWIRRAADLAPARIRDKVHFRFESGIPASCVRCLWGTTALEHARHRSGFAPLSTYHKLDRVFSIAAAERAAQTGSDLLLYSSYAWEAFTFRSSHAPRKILFQYHPHPLLERQILAGDKDNYPDVGESFSGTKRYESDDINRRERDCWKHADLIFCASTFTKRSLIEAGADDRRCFVIPYGIDLPDAADGLLRDDTFQILFVGSGSQRKGLHHLLMAWRHCSLAESSRLVLVCRVIDRAIASLAAATPRVEVRHGVTQQELGKLLANSTLFVMPSLVEGFGQVYLEALARGCPVLGTPNTCLPDLGTEEDGVFMVAPGNIDELIAKIEVLSRFLSGNRLLRKASRDCATRFPWLSFRKALRSRLAA